MPGSPTWTAVSIAMFRAGFGMSGVIARNGSKMGRGGSFLSAAVSIARTAYPRAWPSRGHWSSSISGVACFLRSEGATVSGFSSSAKANAMLFLTLIALCFRRAPGRSATGPSGRPSGWSWVRPTAGWNDSMIVGWSWRLFVIDIGSTPPARCGNMFEMATRTRI